MLWFDLMFDTQALRARGRPSEEQLASIAAYYGRVTTGARPMNRLIAATMLATLAVLVVQLARGDDPRWVAAVSLALVLAAVGVAGARTVPHAVRLGTRRDTPAVQAQLAMAIGREHLVCLSAIATVLVLQLAFAT